MFWLVGMTAGLPFDNLSRDPECLLLRRRAGQNGNPRFGGLVQKNSPKNRQNREALLETSTFGRLLRRPCDQS
jgi:hypothetical protein